MPQTTVATTGVDIVSFNAHRKAITFKHNGTANIIYLDNMQGSAIRPTNAGIALDPKDVVVFVTAFDGVHQVTDRWAAIADAGSQALLWKEFF